MTLVEIVLVVGLLVAGALVTYGCYMIFPPAGFIVGGFIFAAITGLLTIEVG